VDNVATKFDLNLHIAAHESRLECAFAYNTDLFDAATIESLGGYYVQVLAAVAVDPSLRLSGLPLLAGRAMARPDGVRTVAEESDLVTAFEARVATSPKRVAVRTPGCSLSYGALNAQADAVAVALCSLGLSGDAQVPRVGLLAAQDAPMVVGLLGILKSGCAYVPLEPSLPVARLRAQAADAGVSAVVSDAAHAERARAWFGALPVVTATVTGAAGADPAGRRVRRDPAALAYLIYTSGTTGEPKGVMQTHGGALAQVRRYCASLGLEADDRLSLLSGYGFDAAVQDLFGALLTGATLYPLDVRGGTAAGALVDQLVAGRVTVVHATPTVYRYLFGGELHCDQDLSAVRRVVLGGERVRRSDFELYRSRFARGTVFVNGYGLTESTMGLQFFADHDTRLTGLEVPVGTVVPGLEVELCDASGQASWQGEIRVRGTGVFAGYWQRPEWTAARMSADGWYRTGDLGRRLPDGEIVFTGRRDEQLKLRGQRVEPGEIEAALGSLPGIAECAVRSVARAGEDWLVAYVVAAEPVGTSARGSRVAEWRAALAEILPGYMIPQAFEWLPALPRRSNGKLALARLPAPGSPPSPAAVPPRTELEAVLTGLWQDVLAVGSVGIHDDFFALGGHSLLATRLIARIRDRLGVEVPLAGFFEQPTVARVAALIEAHRRDNDAAAATSLTKISRMPRRRQ